MLFWLAVSPGKCLVYYHHPYLQWRFLPQGWWKRWLTGNCNIDYQWPVFCRTSYPYCIPVFWKEKIPAEIIPLWLHFWQGQLPAGLAGSLGQGLQAGWLGPSTTQTRHWENLVLHMVLLVVRFYKMDSGFVWIDFFKQQQQQIFSIWFCESFRSSLRQPSVSRRALHAQRHLSAVPSVPLSVEMKTCPGSGNIKHDLAGMGLGMRRPVQRWSCPKSHALGWLTADCGRRVWGERSPHPGPIPVLGTEKAQHLSPWKTFVLGSQESRKLLQDEKWS